LEILTDLPKKALGILFETLVRMSLSETLTACHAPQQVESLPRLETHTNKPTTPTTPTDGKPRQSEHTRHKPATGKQGESLATVAKANI